MLHFKEKLCKSSGDGRVVNWKIEVLQNNPKELAIIKTTHNIGDGKKVVNERKITSGNNIGKKNEKLILEVALTKAKAKVKKQIDSGYQTVDDFEAGVPAPIRPMLAQNYHTSKHKLKDDIIIEPKLNGLRCVSDVKKGEVGLFTRKGIRYKTMHHIERELKKVFGDLCVDGELYVHGMTLQEINRRVKKYRPGESEEIQYHIYDIIDESLTAVERVNLIHDRLVGNKSFDKNILVPIKAIYIKNNEDDIRSAHSHFVSMGYEGVMVRDRDSKYKPNKRSYCLMKYKDMQDDEFVITGYKTAEGSHSGCIILTCKTKNGFEFDVVPKRTLADRRKMVKEFDEEYLDKMYTVQYQELSEDGVPIFPVGLQVREIN